MSDKDRQKKDGHRKDKKNKAMHDAQNYREQTSTSATQAKDASNLTGTEAGGATANRKSQTNQS